MFFFQKGQQIANQEIENKYGNSPLFNGGPGSGVKGYTTAEYDRPDVAYDRKTGKDEPKPEFGKISGGKEIQSTALGRLHREISSIKDRMDKQQEKINKTPLTFTGKEKKQARVEMKALMEELRVKTKEKNKILGFS